MPAIQFHGDDDMNGRKQLCTFRLGELLFGIDVVVVQEVLSPQVLRKVPLAVSSIGGLINLRGQVVVAIEVRSILDLAPRSSGSVATNIVVRASGGLVSLLVDSIGEIVEVDETQFDPRPESVLNSAAEMVVGTYRLEKRLLVTLDHERVVLNGLAMSEVRT